MRGSNRQSQKDWARNTKLKYLEWMLGVASKWSIAEMRQNLIAAKKDQAETMCV